MSTIVQIVIASPLEAAHVKRIADAYPDDIEVHFRPDLMPHARYLADHTGDPLWRRSPEQQREWRRLLSRAEVLWDFPVAETDQLLELAPKLRWIQTTSAGVGQAVRRHGLQDGAVIVTTASGIHGQPLAEFVFASLLFHSKRFIKVQAAQQTHHWERFCSRELRGQTLVIIGPGRIGREIARIGRCFGMTIWAMAHNNDSKRMGGLGVDRLFARDALHTMLAGADCLVICAPHTPETEGMIGRAEIAALRSSAVLINVARAALVDQEALIDALREQRLAFAALDVFQQEPLPIDSPLWDLPNVLIYPHSASTADSENAKLTERFIVNLGYFLKEQYELMAPVLDKAKLY